MTTYDRPIEARLHVHLATGVSWEAQPADLQRFGLIQRTDAYNAFAQQLTEALETAGLLTAGDLTEAHLNPLRYLAELAICFPDHLNDPETAHTREAVAGLEQRLTTTAAPDTAHPRAVPAGQTAAR